MTTLKSQALLALLAAGNSAQAIQSANCTLTAFSSLTLPNIEILSLSVAATSNTTDANPYGAASIGAYALSVDICQISIQYTHPGQNDTINTWIGLPLEQGSWNHRFLMNGGGGWTAGGETIILAPAAAGYSTSSTDGGHTLAQTAAEWGLVSPGNTNWPALNDFASVALNEAATLGKLATELYYGQSPVYSYWNGCSTGGRQGHMFAQRYPEQFDGILGAAPAINWERFMATEIWSYFVSTQLDTRPPPCVLQAFTDAALAACDALDGVEDGIISLPGQCDFDAQVLVGESVACSAPNATFVISNATAQLVNAIWQGPVSEKGYFEWYGVHKDADLTGLLTTSCTSVDNCTAAPFIVGSDWFSVFLARNASFDYSNMTHAEFDRLYRQSVYEYASAIGTDNPDLTDLKIAGTKLLTWHGMQDQLIPTNGTIDYYERVKNLDPDIEDYYRLFLAPGVGHCGGGDGFDPTDTVFNSLVAWVENGTAPETIVGTGTAVAGNTTATRVVDLCLYPRVLTYTGSDPNDASSFDCI